MVLRVTASGSLVDDALVYLVVTRQRGTGLGGDGREGIVGTLVLQTAERVGQGGEQRLVGQLLRRRYRPEVHGTRAAVFHEAVVVVLEHLLEYGVRPEPIHRCILAAQLELIAVEVPLSHLIDVVARCRDEVTLGFGTLLGGGPRTVVVVNHVDAVVGRRLRRGVLAAVDAVVAAPVEDDVVGKLIVHVQVVLQRFRLVTDTVEARRAAHGVGYETVVHGTVFATPLHAVGAFALDILRVVESLGRDAPLHGGRVGVVECHVLLHRP